MLIEKDKKNLAELQTHHNFQSLRPPPEIYQNNIPEDQYFIDIGNGKKRRRIFYRVAYLPQQQTAIQQVKQMMLGYGIFQNFPDQIILKHLYAVDHDIKKCLERLVQVQDFHNNPVITRFEIQTVKKLESGCIYTYGHDKQMRPIIIIRADRFDYQLSIQENYNVVYNLMLVVLGIRNVPYHAQKYICIFDLADMNMTELPYKYLYEVFKAMGLYYCGNVEKTFIFNSKGIGMMWTMASNLIPEYAKKKISFIKEENQQEILDYIDAYQLQKKYGGKLEDLAEYWPPKCTNEEFDRFEMLRAEQDETSGFYSVDNHLSFFEEKDVGICGDGKCGCPTF